MDLWQPDRLILFLAAFLPGFVSIKVWDLLVAGDSREFNRFWLDAIGYGAFNFAVFSWLILPVWTDGRVPEIWMWPVVFLLGPVFWPILVWGSAPAGG